MKKTLRLASAFLVALPILASATAYAEEVPFVEGKIWGDSAPVLKRSYLIGMSNLLVAEYLYQKEFGPPADKETAIQRLYEGIDDVSLDNAIARIDRWYKNNPDKLDTTVIEVIWLELVRPNLPKSRLYQPGE